MRFVIPLLATGCTAQLLPVQDCETNLQCQDALGYGSVCNAETNLCDVVEMHPRCDATTGQVALPLSKSENYLISTLFGRTEAHTARYRAVELAVEQVNDEAGLDGRLFAAVHCSYEEDPAVDALTQEEAVSEVGAFLATQLGVPVNIGPAASSLSQDLYAAASQEAGMLIISPSATSDALTTIDGLTSTDAEPGLFWRTAPPDGTQGIAIARDMRDIYDADGITVFRRAPSDNVAIVFEQGAYGEGLATIVATELTSRGGTSSPFPFDNDAGRSQAVADIAADGSFDEVLIISARAEDYSGFLLGASGNAWYDDVPIFITDGGRTVEMLAEASAAQSLFDNIRGSVAKTPGGVVFDTFDAGYRARYSVSAADHSYTAHSYDAAWIALYGHAWAVGNEERIDGTGIARGLRHLSSGNNTNIQPSNWTGIASTLEAGGNVDLTGTSGPIDWDPQVAEIAGVIEIYTVNGSNDGFVEDYTFGE